MKLAAACALSSLPLVVLGQVSLEPGTYSQNFDQLAGSGTANSWNDNQTLLGWYAEALNGFGGDYRASSGTSTAGDLYSFGTDSDRSLGSLSSGTPGDLAYGLRLRNTSASRLGNIQITYTGEQWRNNNNVNAQTLEFSFQTGTDLTSPDVANSGSWTDLSTLSFTSPVTGDSATALDGNAPGNRLELTAVLSGVELDPGQELFLRWRDSNDAGNDHGLGIDDLTVSVSVVPEPSSLVLGGLLGLAVARWRARRG